MELRPCSFFTKYAHGGMQTERKQRKDRPFTLLKDKKITRRAPPPVSVWGSKFGGSQVRVRWASVVFCPLMSGCSRQGKCRDKLVSRDSGPWKPTRRTSKSFVRTTETQWRVWTAKPGPELGRSHFSHCVCVSRRAAWLQTSRQFLFFPNTSYLQLHHGSWGTAVAA